MNIRHAIKDIAISWEIASFCCYQSDLPVLQDRPEEKQDVGL